MADKLDTTFCDLITLTRKLDKEDPSRLDRLLDWIRDREGETRMLLEIAKRDNDRDIEQLRSKQEETRASLQEKIDQSGDAQQRIMRERSLHMYESEIASYDHMYGESYKRKIASTVSKHNHAIGENVKEFIAARK